MCSAVRTTALGGACEVQRVPYSFSVSTDYSGESKQHVLEPCLVPPFFRIWHYAKRRFSVISNLRYMHGVLNVDEIKN